MIELINIYKEFKCNSFFKSSKPKSVLKDINFKIKEGEILSILGESGSGKSTLAKIICNLTKPTSGKILFNGVDTNFINKKDFFREIQIVFQDSISSVNPVLTVFEAIKEPLDYLSDMNLTQKKERVLQLLDLVNLDKSYINAKSATLSGGMLQRLSIARAMAIKPKFIILDEATSSVDLVLQNQILDMVLALKKDTSFVIITHDIRIAKLMSDKIIVLDGGRIAEILDKKSGFAFQSKIGIELENSILPAYPKK